MCRLGGQARSSWALCRLRAVFTGELLKGASSSCTDHRMNRGRMRMRTLSVHAVRRGLGVGRVGCVGRVGVLVG